MKAIVYHGPGQKAWQEVPDPEITGGQINAGRFITYHFGLDDFDEAYEAFAHAADTGALKVVLTR